MIDFDAVYRELIEPAIRAADLEPIRADEELVGGIIHKPMFERLILCPYAVADLTTANANVFYELGLRHALRPASTVLIFAEGGGQLPFDVAPLRAMPYGLGADGKPNAAEPQSRALTARLRDARGGAADSPLFQLVEGFPDIQRLKTDVFRERLSYSQETKRRLAAARKSGAEAVREVERSLGSIADAETAVVVDLFLSYRAVSAHEDMIELVKKMSPPLAATVMVQEQLGFALNRAGRGDEAEQVLSDVLAQRGPSSETYGLLGRVYKDRWDEAVKRGDQLRARGLLGKAIEAYLRGFEADWRDAYPGVNALSLMELREPPDERQRELLPVVRYAVKRRMAAGKPDYWDHATLLELAVLAGDEAAAVDALSIALGELREAWEAETTARNLRLIREARERRGTSQPWLNEVVQELERAAQSRRPSRSAT